MNLFLDDQPVRADEVDELGTLNDTVRSVQSEVCPPDRLVVRLKCDGREIGSEQMRSTLESPTQSFAKVELFTSTKSLLVADVMDQAAVSLEETNEASHRAGALLSEGKTNDGVQQLAECLQVWQQIHDAIAKSIALLAIDTDAVHVQDESLSSALGKPRDVLMQIKQALEVQDMVLLADVLLYDFSDVTEHWRRIINCIRAESEAG